MNIVSMVSTQRVLDSRLNPQLAITECLDWIAATAYAWRVWSTACMRSHAMKFEVQVFLYHGEFISE